MFIGKQFKGTSKNIERYGVPRIFFRNIVEKLKSDFPDYKTIIENDSRLKIKFQSKSFSLQTDFIYMNNHIQICLTFDSMNESNTISYYKLVQY